MKKYHSRYFHLLYTLEAIKGVKGKLLDVSCGSGWLLKEIASVKPDLKLYGCDIVKRFKKESFSFKRMDASKLSYKSNYFDAVVMMDLLEHLKSPSIAVSEVSRVLKPKGVFHLVVPLEGEACAIDGLIKRLGGKNLKEKPIGHVQQFKLKDVKMLLQKRGLAILKIHYSYHLLYQLISFIYFTKINILDNGEYKPLRANRFLINLVGFFVYIEDLLLSKVRGQEAHIMAIKK